MAISWYQTQTIPNGKNHDRGARLLFGLAVGGGTHISGVVVGGGHDKPLVKNKNGHFLST